MADNNVYEQLAEMYYAAGAPKTDTTMKILSLQFTPLEARLAVQIGYSGGQIEELVQKTGMEEGKLLKTLKTMAYKGTMWIDPGVDDPTYKVVQMAAPGITETGAWLNIKFPYSVELGKTLHPFLKEWAEETLSKVGVPFAPVWASPTALPDGAPPSENLAEVIKDRGHWSVSVCPCRFAHWLADPGNHCDHILEACLHMGDVSRWTVEHGMARELSYEEAIELLRKCNEDGLVHTLDINDCICNCCNDCCAMFHSHNTGVKVFRPSPFISQIDEDACNACKDCADVCPVGAIEVDEFAYVDQETCLGCGVCVPTCTTESIKLVRRS